MGFALDEFFSDVDVAPVLRDLAETEPRKPHVIEVYDFARRKIYRSCLMWSGPESGPEGFQAHRGAMGLRAHRDQEKPVYKPLRERPARVTRPMIPTPTLTGSS